MAVFLLNVWEDPMFHEDRLLLNLKEYQLLLKKQKMKVKIQRTTKSDQRTWKTRRLWQRRTFLTKTIPKLFPLFTHFIEPKKSDFLPFFHYSLLKNSAADMMILQITWYQWLYHKHWHFLTCFSLTEFFPPNLGPINCLWSGFGQWSRCSVSCGTGTEQRKRMVLQQAKNGGEKCSGEAVETKPCKQPSCPGKWWIV